MSAPSAAPKAETKPQPQPSVSVDTTLASMFEAKDTAERKSFVDIVTYIKDNSVSEATIRFTLTEEKSKGGRGMSSQSASVILSNIKGLLKEENKQVLADLQAGKITVAESRKLAQVGSTRGRKADSAKSDPVDVALTKLAFTALAAAPPVSLQDLVQRLQKAYADAETDLKNQKSKGQQQPSQGSFSAAPAAQPPQAQAQPQPPQAQPQPANTKATAKK